MKYRFGFFDSGVGGFTVLKKILDNYPGATAVYLGDTARLPYGSKKPKEIRTIANEVVEWLRNQDLTAIFVSCNTTNALALDIIRNGLDLPCFGLIESAAEMIKEGRVGVLGTSTTVQSKSYTKEILRLRPKTFVIEQACPAFVPLIEMGQISFDQVEKIATEYLRPLLEANVEVIVLGCTHYPFLGNTLKKLIPSNVRLLDPANGLVEKFRNFLGPVEIDFEGPRSFANTRFCATSDPNGLALKASYWLGIRPDVELVSLHKKACVF